MTIPARRRAFGALVACLLAGPAVGVAQETPAPPDSAVPQPPQPVPIDSIPDRARANMATILGLRGRLPSDSVVRRLDSSLAVIQADFDRHESSVTRARLDSLYGEDLNDLHNRWRDLAGRLEAWRGRATSLTGAVDGIRDSLQRIREQWTVTRGAGLAGVPAPVREQVAGVLRAADSVLADVTPIRDRLLTIQGDGAQLDVAITGWLTDVEDAQSLARRRLLRQDSPPLWRAFGRPTVAAAPDTAAVDSTRAGPAANPFGRAIEYLTNQGGRVRLHVGLFLLLVVAFWLVGRRRQYWATTEFAMHWPTRLLAHPVAAAAVLALVFARGFYPGAPRGVFALLFLVAVPPLIVLLRQMLDQVLRAPTYVLIGLFAFRLLADAFSWDPIVARVALLLLAGLGTTAFVWFAHLIAQVITPSGRGGRWWRAGRLAAWTAAGLLGVAVVANVFGFVVLADLLVLGTFASALAAMALVALVDVVVGAVLVGLMATPVGALQVVRTNRTALSSRVGTLVRVGAGIFWIGLALRQFQLYRPTLAALGTALTAPVNLGSWDFTIRDVLVFVVALVGAVYIARGLRAVLRHDVLVRMDLGRGVPEAASSIVYYVALALGLIFAAGAAGIGFGQLTLIAGALGVGIGFGLQTIVANFISGLILLFERPIQSGDTVELQGLIGVVQSIGIRASTVRTFQGADVIVPNQDLIAGRVVNWTLSDQLRRVEVPVGVAYGSDPAQVITLMRETTQAHPKVVDRPEAEVLFTGYGDSALDFEIRFWARFDDWLTVRSDVLVAVYAAFAEQGIEIPFPQRDLHLRSVDQGVQAALKGGRT